MTSPTGRLDTTPSRGAQCPMLSAPDLIPSLHAAAGHLLTELHHLHPGLTADAQNLVSLMDAVTVQAVNLLVRQASSFEVVVDCTGEDVLIAVQGGGRVHALSVRDLTRALMYVTPSGLTLHLAFEEHLLNRDDAVDVLLRLSITPAWNDLLTQSTHNTVRALTLMTEGGMDVHTAELLILQDAADLAGQPQVAYQPRTGALLALQPAARHSA